MRTADWLRTKRTDTGLLWRTVFSAKDALNDFIAARIGDQTRRDRHASGR